MIVRDERSRKNGIVSSVSRIALSPCDRQPLASQSANGNASTSSITVMPMAMRSVRVATVQRPVSKKRSQV